MFELTKHLNPFNQKRILNTKLMALFYHESALTSNKIEKCLHQIVSNANIYCHN